MGLIVVFHKGEACERVALEETPVLAGTAGECKIHLAGDLIGAHHAALVEKSGVVGLKTMNDGVETRVNSQIVRDASVRIHTGDRIEIGEYTLVYYGNPEEAPGSVASLSEEIPTPVSSIVPLEADSEILIAPSDMIDQDETEELDAAHVPPDPGDSDVASGEFIEPDTHEYVEFSTSTGECELITAPEPLLNMIRGRLSLFKELDRLEAERAGLLKDSSALPEIVQSEYRRQSREAKDIPTAERCIANLERVRKRIDEAEQAAAADAGASGEASAAHEEDAEGSTPKPLDPLFREALGMAAHQWELFIERTEKEEPLLAEALSLAKKEPLYWVLSEARINADALFAWAAYALSLESIGHKQSRKRKSLHQKRVELEQTKKGVLGLFRRGKTEASTELETLVSEEEDCMAVLSWVARELAAIEKTMAREFWAVYEAAALLLIKETMGRQEEIQVRAFLRFGLLGCHEWFLPREKARMLLENASHWHVGWDDRMATTHVLYADEYIYFVAKGKITPSVDENIELNMRNTPIWKADRAWRRLTYTRPREAALRELRQTLSERVDALHKQKSDMEYARDKLIRGAKDYKETYRAYAQKIQHHRVEAARFERAVARIDEVYLPAVLEQRDDSLLKLSDLDVAITPESLVHREVKGMRRVTRLCANLREPFLPFVLRDNCKPGTEAMNDREAMLAELEEVERRDPAIFKEPLMAVKKKTHRLYMRFSPVVLLTPGCGFLGYAWNPRAGAELGRMAVPVYMPRPRLRERLLQNMLSDFRWDTSKASAGVDLLTSDTLVAAYANVRWEYRKKSKEAREKSGIFNEENDRKNWRRHYGLYLSSALDSGKKLFFKCYEAYEQVVLKYIDLPDDVERLRR